MRKIATLFAFALASVLAFPAAAQKCETGTAKKPLVGTEVLYLPSPAGPIAPHRKANVKIACGSLITREGLVDQNGKLLVPAVYNAVLPLTPTLAAVQYRTMGGPPSRQLEEPYYVYLYGKGEQKTKFPYRFMSDFVSGNVRYPYGYISEPGKFEYYMYTNGTDQPTALRNLGGKGWPPSASALDREGDVLFANFTSPEGTPVTRILNLKGEPISPVIGGVERWETKPTADFGVYERNPYEKPLSVDYISLAYAAEHPDLPYGRVYIPVSKFGTPLQLPAAALGVFPLIADPTSFSKHTFGWAIVYAHQTGFRIRWGLGALGDVIARAGTLPEVSGMQRLNDGRTFSNAAIRDVFAIRNPTDGLWRMVYADTLKPGGMGAADPGTAASARALYHRYIAERMDYQRGIQRKQVEDRARSDANLFAWQDQKYRALLASGKLCANPYATLELHNAAIAHVLRECANVRPDFLEFAAARRVDPNAINVARNGYNGRVEAAQLAAAAEARRAREWEVANAPINWNSWSDQMLKDMRNSSDGFIRDQRRKYYDNLRAWNSGKQNWCC